MEPIEALHTAARRYCTERHDDYLREYCKLTAVGGERMTFRSGRWEYSEQAWDLFPRYRILEAIRSDVEHYVPSDFASLPQVREMLEEAGETAQIDSTPFTHPTAVAAVAEERRRFVEFVRSADVAELSRQPPLPLRRVLGEAEHASLYEAFVRRWGKWYGGCCDREWPPEEVVTLHVEAMESPGAYEDLRRVLADHGIGRVVELREWGDGCECDLDGAGFTYTGAEGFWTSVDMGWMVQASHESSITFGGAWLVAAMRSHLPRFERYLYRGWDLAAYE